MVVLYSSNNSEFFAVRESGRVHLYKESFQDITHRVNDRMAGELIHLSDGGECFFRSEEGLFRLRREKGVRADRCNAVRSLDGSPEGGVLKGFAVRSDGDQIAYEQVLPAQKFTSKLKRFLGKKSAQGDVGPRLHRFIVSQWSGRSSTSYYETIVDPRTSAGLVWWTSPDFGFLAIMERERDGRSFLRLIDILDETVVNELVVEGRLSRDRFLTSNGSVGFGLEKGGRRAFVIWTYSQERFGVSYPKDSRVIHLGKDKVVFQSQKHEFVIAKDYQNRVIAEASLKALSDMDVKYLLSFNPRRTLELVTFHKGRLRVHHTDLESLPIDAKRWELLGERRRSEQLEAAADRVIQEDESIRDQESHQARQVELMHEMEEQVEIPEALPEQIASMEIQQPSRERERKDEVEAPSNNDGDAVKFSTLGDAQEALERLRMRYIAGELTREDYYNEKTLIERASSGLPSGGEVSSRPSPRTLDFVGE